MAYRLYFFSLPLKVLILKIKSKSIFRMSDRSIELKQLYIIIYKKIKKKLHIKFKIKIKKLGCFAVSKSN